MFNDFLPQRYTGKLLSLLLPSALFCLQVMAQQSLVMSNKAANSEGEPLGVASIMQGNNPSFFSPVTEHADTTL